MKEMTTEVTGPLGGMTSVSTGSPAQRPERPRFRTILRKDLRAGGVTQ